MIALRKSEARGHANRGWLDSYFTFSFDSYHDPKYMNFGPLRVINQDKVEGGHGFPMHNHRDMEIITYVLEGALEHKDSLGTGSVVRPGDVQRMSAGTGIAHSEANPEPDTTVHLLQIWIMPEQRGLAPSYEQKAYSEAERRGQLRLIAARGGRDGAVTIHQDVDVYAALLDNGERVTHNLAPQRVAWLHVARGSVTLNGSTLQAGDGAAIEEESSLELSGVENAEILLFDMSR